MDERTTVDGTGVALDGLPSYFETHDGHPLIVRLIRPDDAARLLVLFEGLSSETRRRRFHADVDHLSDEVKVSAAQRFANVDNQFEAGAIVAVDNDGAGGEQIVGVARLSRRTYSHDMREAEAAIVVRDDFQGRGVGTELLQRLVTLAKHMQFQQMVAEIEADNLSAIRLFRSLDLPTTARTRHAETILTLSLQ